MKLALIICIILVSPQAFGGVTAADNLTMQRRQFVEAYRAVTAGQSARVDTLMRGLEAYPLYIYLRHFGLSRSLHNSPAPVVREFLAAYDGSLLADRLRTDWLNLLSQRQQWADLVVDYRPQTDTKLQCAYLTARIETGALEGVLAEARRLWMSGTSQPEECNRAFEFIADKNVLDDAHLWQRMQLAMEKKIWASRVTSHAR